MKDVELSAIPQNTQEARCIAWAIAQGWELRTKIASASSGREEKDDEDEQDDDQDGPYPGQCDDCPGRSHPLCCWSTED